MNTSLSCPTTGLFKSNRSEKFQTTMQRHFKVKPPSPNDTVPHLVPRADVHNVMMEQLTGDKFGVYVHWSVFHSGKSTSSKLVANWLWSAEKDVKYINARLTSIPEDKMSAEQWFRRVAEFSDISDNTISIAECFEKYSLRAPNHSIMIIDEADLMLDYSGADELIRALAHASTIQSSNDSKCCSACRILVTPRTFWI